MDRVQLTGLRNSQPASASLPCPPPDAPGRAVRRDKWHLRCHGHLFHAETLAQKVRLAKESLIYGCGESYTTAGVDVMNAGIEAVLTPSVAFDTFCPPHVLQPLLSPFEMLLLHSSSMWTRYGHGVSPSDNH
ncbi:unnamed protein product [Pleuronectes platessa]|uniref:Uncharacterized protein n=1 Tax=Pleuronectes platessa TaxID=8262 RepID=A0A9N7YYI0_PLEPL|nr:unnamed protein product [Pleuronectes platessa]